MMRSCSAGPPALLAGARRSGGARVAFVFRGPGASALRLARRAALAEGPALVRAASPAALLGACQSRESSASSGGPRGT
eukprot:5179750-Alexandrium_andersonii.AAC.1